MPGAPVLFAVELAVLYSAGSAAIGHLLRMSGAGGRGGVLGGVAFYLAVFPGVILHECAHYLACLLTGTKVSRFAPFSPARLDDGRLMLGYVRHERRAFPVGAIIGLAPMVLNPLGVLSVTALLTPLSFREIADPSVGVVAERIFASGFVNGTPLLAAVWAYLSVSFALGSVPSREDLSGLPLLLLVLGGAAAFALLLGTGPKGARFPAVDELFSLMAGLYALPAAVAAVVALVVGLAGSAIRR